MRHDIINDISIIKSYLDLYRLERDLSYLKKVDDKIQHIIDGEWVILKISDNGKGIPEEFREKIFEEGFKYGNSANTGLGLYLVKQTIDRYGGSIEINENSPSGAVFLIKLKKA